MTLFFIQKLNFLSYKVDINTQKINKTILSIYNRAITSFLLQNKYIKDCFFWGNISINKFKHRSGLGNNISYFIWCRYTIC